jgi:glucose-1-phosphate adenylyltransferase
MNETKVFILAGGVGKRLSLLTQFRAKPAVPFAGRYRIIDFTLTNCVRSGLHDIYLLTQYISRSINRHVGIGKPWELDRTSGGIRHLQPHLGFQAADWYRGTADAIFQNLSVLRESACRNVLILSGDHIYNMDYRDFIRFRTESGMPAALGVAEVPLTMCREFGIATVDSKGFIKKFEEKPESTSSNLASMGIYVFEKDFLIRTLDRMRKRISNLDFGMHVIPELVKKEKISAYRFGGYWLDIGTLRSYYSASLGLLAKRPRLDLFGDETRIITVPDDSMPSVLSRSAVVERSLVCNGCTVDGTVRSSILSPGVVVERGARVEDSILLHDCVVKRDAVVKNAIIDKMAEIGRNATIGEGDASVPNNLQPDYLDFGLTVIGRKTVVPRGTRIGTNCLVCGSQDDGKIRRGDIEDGGYRIADDVKI